MKMYLHHIGYHRFRACMVTDCLSYVGEYMIIENRDGAFKIVKNVYYSDPEGNRIDIIDFTPSQKLLLPFKYGYPILNIEVIKHRLLTQHGDVVHTVEQLAF